MNILHNIPLNEYCTYKTGGNAEHFARPETEGELLEAMRYADENSLPVTYLGSGSNVLISDDGVRGLVIILSALEKNITASDAGDGVYVTAGAGISLDELVKYCVGNGYGGIEALSGIPGSVGGAVVMNAGAFGVEMKDVVETIRLTDNSFQVSEIKNSGAGFEYRNAQNLKNKVIISVKFFLKKCNSLFLKEKSDAIVCKRSDKQPLEYPSCGSVFKRPKGAYAGALIEQCGLKGEKLGGAMVSEKHANFVVNSGGASSKDIKDLITKVKNTVYKQTGILLEEEVRYIGFDK